MGVPHDLQGCRGFHTPQIRHCAVDCRGPGAFQWATMRTEVKVAKTRVKHPGSQLSLAGTFLSWVAFSDKKRNIGTQHTLTTHNTRSQTQHTLTNTTHAHEAHKKLTSTTHAHEIQKKLTNTEEADEYSRNSRQ